jgi:hypothetical protein
MLSFWLKLQKKKLRSKQVAVARVLVVVASEIFHKSKGWGPVIRRLE